MLTTKALTEGESLEITISKALKILSTSEKLSISLKVLKKTVFSFFSNHIDQRKVLILLSQRGRLKSHSTHKKCNNSSPTTNSTIVFHFR